MTGNEVQRMSAYDWERVHMTGNELQMTGNELQMTGNELHMTGNEVQRMSADDWE